MTRTDNPEQTGQTRGYWAFISYSHTDEKAAAELHRYLERLRIPRHLVGRKTGQGQIPRRLRPVFRDREEFPASADLGRAIRGALTASRNLIVICSPNSADSQWVGEEIRQFKTLGREDWLFCYLVEGVPEGGGDTGVADGAFASTLLQRFDADGQRQTGSVPEPLAVDPGKDGKSIARMKLVAGLLGIEFDELRQRVRRQTVHRASFAALLFVAVSATLSTLWYQGRQESRLAQSQQLASTARQIYEDRPLVGLHLALEAAATAPSHNTDALRTIIETGKALARRGRIAKLGSDVERVIVDKRSLRFAIDFSERPGELRSGVDGSLIATLPRPVYGLEFLAEADDDYFLVDYRGDSELRRSVDGSKVATLVATARVRFSPDPDRRFFFVTNSGGYPAELRQRATGALVPLQPDSRASSVTFSRDPEWRWFVVEYYSDHPTELRRTDDFSVVELPSVPERISFSHDRRTRRLLIQYADGKLELRRTDDLTLIRRLPHGTQRAFFDRTGTRIKIKSSDGEYTLRSLDGESGPSREVFSEDPAQSYRAVLDDDAARWWRESDGKLLVTQTGAYRSASFSRDDPPTYISLGRSSAGYEIRRVSDASLVHAFEQALSVQLDVAHMLVRFGNRAELWRVGDAERLVELPRTSARTRPAVFDSEYVLIALGDGGKALRRLSDGSMVTSLPDAAVRVRMTKAGLFEVLYADGSVEIRRLDDADHAMTTLQDTVEILYPEPGLVTLRHADGTLEPRRLSDGAAIRLPSNRRIVGAEFLSPDARYTLLSYVGGTADLIRTVDGKLIADLTGPGAFAGVTLVPERGARYLLVDYDVTWSNYLRQPS